MNLSWTRLIAAIFALGSSYGLHAEAEIDRLVAQSGIEVGEVAMRDMPGWRTPRKIIIRNIGVPRDMIRAALPGVDVVFVQNEAEAFSNAAQADAIIGWCSERLAQTNKLVWMQIFSAGAERCVDVPAIANRSVVLTNMQKMSSPVIGEHMTAMMLSLARGLPQFAKNMRHGRWDRGGAIVGSMQSIAGKTVLVVGLGGIGTEVARRAAALEMRVIGTRRTSREGPDFVSYVGLADELHELAAEADFIVNALPLTPATTGLFDADFFAITKPGAFFLNAGRGRSVVTDDLVAALENGQIAGAGLDVTDPEPLPADHPLWQIDNVIITPHVSSRGGDREWHQVLLLENLKRFVAGDALFNVVDPDAGY